MTLTGAFLLHPSVQGISMKKNDIRWRECVTDEALLQFREAGKGSLEFPYAAVLEPPHQVEKFIYVYGVETEL
jgi:hypothetical protein